MRREARRKVLIVPLSVFTNIITVVRNFDARWVGDNAFLKEVAGLIWGWWEVGGGICGRHGGICGRGSMGSVWLDGGWMV